MLTSQISNPPLWTFFVECWVECGSTSLPWQCYGNSFHPVGMLLSQYTLFVGEGEGCNSFIIITYYYHDYYYHHYMHLCESDNMCVIDILPTLS